MQTHDFLNRIRSLSNIDGHLLPELTRDQQARFLADPIGYFLLADDVQADAIMREVERRQEEALERFAAVPKKSKKAKPRIPEQREMLLPISGGMGAEKSVTPATNTSARRKAG